LRHRLWVFFWYRALEYNDRGIGELKLSGVVDIDELELCRGADGLDGLVGDGKVL
jgi:hypothetical protein